MNCKEHSDHRQTRSTAQFTAVCPSNFIETAVRTRKDQSDQSLQHKKLGTLPQSLMGTVRPVTQWKIHHNELEWLENGMEFKLP